MLRQNHNQTRDVDRDEFSFAVCRYGFGPGDASILYESGPSRGPCSESSCTDGILSRSLRHCALTYIYTKNHQVLQLSPGSCCGPLIVTLESETVTGGLVAMLVTGTRVVVRCVMIAAGA